MKLKGLSVGAENNNSKFGFIINPAVLAKNPCCCVALSTNNPVIAACTSGVFLYTVFTKLPIASAPPDTPLVILPDTTLPIAACAALESAPPQVTAFKSDIPLGIGRTTVPIIWVSFPLTFQSSIVGERRVLSPYPNLSLEYVFGLY